MTTEASMVARPNGTSALIDNGMMSPVPIGAI
jgi:hypothetical protein